MPNDLEQAVLRAVTAEPVSTSVLKMRAGVPLRFRNAAVLAACLALEARGLIRRTRVGSTTRWHRDDTTLPDTEPSTARARRGGERDAARA